MYAMDPDADESMSDNSDNDIAEVSPEAEADGSSGNI
jgi:hypothetical protein